MKKIGIIPARGGSKRIPQKNIKDFCGKPIIAWSIEAALESGCFDDVIVSTEDENVADVARAFGASVPFLRPPALADDHTGTTPVIAHAIRWFQRTGISLSHACCIYATAPFLRPDDLRRGLALLDAEGCDYAFSVADYAFPIQRAIRITDQRRVQMFQPEYLQSRSQDLEGAWHDAGQFYWGLSNAWIEGRPVFSSSAVPLVLPRHLVHDIDSPEDWALAELIFGALKDKAMQS